MPNPRKRSPEAKPSNVWRCETCRSQEMTFEQAKQHLKEKHGLDPATTKATSVLRTILDGDTWFSTEYEVTIELPSGNLKFTNSIVSPRDEDNTTRHA